MNTAPDLQIEVPVLDVLLVALQHHLTLALQLGHLGAGFVPQLVRDAEVHLHPLGHQALQRGECLALPFGKPGGVLPLLY